MIRHVVMLNLRADTDASELTFLMKKLADLTTDIPGFDHFEHGPNRDFEGKSKNYPYGFICSFADKTALDAYAADPRHRAAGAGLVALCEDGADGIMVMDLNI